MESRGVVCFLGERGCFVVCLVGGGVRSGWVVWSVFRVF